MTAFRGRWQTWLYKFEHQHHRYERGGFITKRAALNAEWARRQELGAAKGEDPRGDTTLAEYAETWLGQIAADLKPATVANYRERLDHHVLPILGRLALRALTRQHVVQLLNTKREHGYSRNGVRLVKAALSAMLSDAADEGTIPANPALGMSRRRQRRQTGARPEPNPMSRAQRDTFLVAARGRRYALLFELLAKTGLRPSEAFALRAGDVDGARLLIRTSKTEEPREVDLTAGLVVALRRHAKGQGLVFTTKTGEPLDHRLLGKSFRRVLKKAGLPHFRLYDLRHTYASLRLQDGAPITYVAAQLGHASPVTTFRYYARWVPEKGRRWVEREGTPRRIAGESVGAGKV